MDQSTSAIKSWIQQRIFVYQISISALRRNLERRFGDNYRVKIKDADTVVLTLPHALSRRELYDLRHKSSYNYNSRQNEIFQALPDAKERVSHSLQSAPRSTEDLPATQHQDTAASSDTGGIVDADKDEQVLEAPDANEIPFVHLASQWIILVDIGTGSKSGGQGFAKLEQPATSKRDHKTQSGLYSVPRDKGATSSVFEVTGRILRSTDGPSRLESEAVVQKFAVKRLDKNTAAAQFWAEYNSLKLIKSLNHPHMVETLSAFRCEENGHQYLNFLFPMALGNLKQLLRGSYDENMGIQKSARESLWDQFAGLSSAVAYLHDSVQMAHRDIKPSNILVYGEPSSDGSLVLKLADFGLAIDLSKAPTWEAQQLTWPYDSPEIRRTSPNDELNTPSDEGIHIPSAAELLANDIWKLGCVFTEMVAFLVCGGSAGVTNFRDFITTTEDKISSDMFNDTRFDDGEKVKDQVLDWIGQMARKDMRAEWLQPILCGMLAKSAERLTISRVCNALVQVDFPSINFDDGLRLVRFAPADRTKALSRRESLQLAVEEWIGRPVDWWPFPSPRPRLSPNKFLMTWKWQGIELCMPLSRDELRSYKLACLPKITNNLPLLPIANQQSNSSKPSPTNVPSNTIGQLGGINNQSPLGNIALAGGTTQSFTPTPGISPSKDIYWCVEKTFTEPTETHLFSILNSEALVDDEELYCQVNQAISSARGWLGWLFSWTRCTEVEFIEFYIVRHDHTEVDPKNAGALPPDSTPHYTHAVPTPHEVQMRLARIQMVAGLRYPCKGKGETTIKSMLPKKINPPPLAKEMGQNGWGLHAKMGFSQWRFMCWLIVCFVLNFIFVTLWLVYINPTDLQNAFVPTFVVTVLFTFGLAVVQMSELRDTK